MAKKIADMMTGKPDADQADHGREAYADLANHAMSLHEPNDFHHGHRLGETRIIDNILLFVRTQTKQIGAIGRRNFHNRNVLLIPLRGSGRIIVNAHAYALEAGHCLLIAPYQFHHYSDILDNEFCWLFVTFECVGETERRAGICRPADAAAFATDLRQLIRTYLSPEKTDIALQLACRLSLLLANLQSHRDPDKRRQRPSHSEDLLLRVHALLSANLHRILSIAEISCMLGMSESSLRSQFRSASGYSLGNFQQTLRLQHAARLLNKKPHVSVAEVAAACGWDSPYAFSRAFSKYWDLPPKKFAKQILIN